MKVGRIVAPGKFEFVEKEIPKPHESGQVVMRLAKGAVCGSDMRAFTHTHESYPLSDGVSLHECVGTVHSSRSKQFKEGDKVLYFPVNYIGLQEYFMTTEDRIIHLPQCESLNTILMGQLLGTVLFAMRKIGNIVLKHTVVQGAGPAGLLIASQLNRLGAKTVIALDKIDYRLEVAKKMGATHTINVTKGNAADEIRDITGGNMADLVVEAVGHQEEAINESIPFVKLGGKLMLFGLPDPGTYSVDLESLLINNTNVICTINPDTNDDFILGCDMIAQGRVDVSHLITHELPFEEAQKGFELYRDRDPGVLKVILST